MNFTDANFDELDEYITGRIVFGKAGLGPILTGHLLIERVIETLLESKIKNAKKLFLDYKVGFEFKVDLAFSLGLIDEKHRSAFKAINGVRNDFSHREEFLLTAERLNSFKFDYEDMQERVWKKTKSQSVEDLASIAIIFLCWKAIHLIKKP